MNSYIISDISQLVYIPENDLKLKIVLDCIRGIKHYNSDIFRVLHLKLYNEYVLSMIYEIESTATDRYPYVYNINEIVSTLNNNGFDITYQPHIDLNETERTILQDVYDLGYRFIQYGRYNEDNAKIPVSIYIAKNPLSTGSSNQEYVRLESITDKINVNDFVWLRSNPLESMSIDLLLDATAPIQV